ncbi:hypothetical protein MIDIC_500018 [Alphaproteobacteria bacterium]
MGVGVTGHARIVERYRLCEESLIGVAEKFSVNAKTIAE